MHSAAPELAVIVPGGQSSHVPPSNGFALPASQSLHVTCKTSLAVPAGQDVQLTLPDIGEMVPVAQGWQLPALTSLKEPG